MFSSFHNSSLANRYSPLVICIFYRESSIDNSHFASFFPPFLSLLFLLSITNRRLSHRSMSPSSRTTRPHISKVQITQQKTYKVGNHRVSWWPMSSWRRVLIFMDICNSVLWLPKNHDNAAKLSLIWFAEVANGVREGLRALVYDLHYFRESLDLNAVA